MERRENKSNVDNSSICVVDDNTKKANTRKRKCVQSKLCSCIPLKRIRNCNSNRVSCFSNIAKQTLNHVNKHNNEDITRFLAQSGQVFLNLAQITNSSSKNGSYVDYTNEGMNKL